MIKQLYQTGGNGDQFISEKYRQIFIHHAIPSGKHLIGPKFLSAA
jgi:hypothetical protein